MVRGNWQKRVEKAEARRAATKHRRQNRENRNVYKSRVLQFYSWLDEHCKSWSGDGSSSGVGVGCGGGNRDGAEVNVWVDSIPRKSIFDRSEKETHKEEEEEEEKEKIRNKSGSAPRTPSSHSKHKSKKAHPRSHFKTPLSPEEMGEKKEEDEPMPLCRRSFFVVDGCPSSSGSGGRGGCGGKCTHYPKRGGEGTLTLAGALLPRDRKHHKKRGKHNSSSNSSSSSGAAASSSSSSSISKEETERMESINSKKKILAENALKASSTAAATAYISMSSEDDNDVDGGSPPSLSEDGPMDMVYPLSVPATTTTKHSSSNNKDDDDDDNKEGAQKSPSLSEVISQTLNKHNCTTSSIVYVTLNNVLLFDRHRGGLVVTEAEKEVLFPTSSVAKRERALSNATTGEGGEEEYQRLVTHLPGTILEYILTFLPDSSAAVLPLVCKGWSREVGKSSHNLWRFLLNRRGWPIPNDGYDIHNGNDGGNGHRLVSSGSSKQEEKEKEETDSYKKIYLAHYAAVRDVNAIAMSIRSFSVSGSSSSAPSALQGREAASQSFKSIQNAPSYPDVCANIKVWSNTRALAAYTYDCTLRLFEAVPSSSSNEVGGIGSNLTCRQIVCVNASPIPNAKRGNVRLVAMDLNDLIVGCLYEVDENSGGVHRATATRTTVYLVVVQREDLLCCAGGGGGRRSLEDELEENQGQKSYNLREKVLDYLVSHPADDDIHDHMQVLGDLTYMNVLLTSSLIMCGGNDMIAFECAILVPSYEDDPDHDLGGNDLNEYYEHGMSDGAPRTMIMAGRRFCVFSTRTECIVWMEDADPNGLSDVTSTLILVGYREEGGKQQQRRRGGGGPTTVAVTTQDSEAVLTMEIQPNGEIIKKESLEIAPRKELSVLEGYESVSASARPALITSSDVIVADNLSLARNNPNRNLPKVRGVLSFIPNPQGAKMHRNKESAKYIVLDGERNIIRLVSVRDEHIMVLCDEAEKNDGGQEETLPLPYPRRSLLAVIIHVPSRTIIKEVRLGDASADFGLTTLNAIRQSPIFFSVSGESMAIGVSWLGIILTGAAVRALGDSGHQDSQEGVSDKGGEGEKRKKKKKNKKNVSKGKKDGFARGMSLRG